MMQGRISTSMYMRSAKYQLNFDEPSSLKTRRSTIASGNRETKGAIHPPARKSTLCIARQSHPNCFKWMVVGDCARFAVAARCDETAANSWLVPLIRHLVSSTSPQSLEQFSSLPACQRQGY